MSNSRSRTGTISISAATSRTLFDPSHPAGARNWNRFCERLLAETAPIERGQSIYKKTPGYYFGHSEDRTVVEEVK